MHVKPKVGGWLLIPIVSLGFGQIVAASDILDGWMGLDIGPDSIKTFNEALDTTKIVIWNGPMGVFEFENFDARTEVMVVALF